MLCLAKCWEYTADPWFLVAIKDVLKEADADLNCRPPEECRELQLFIEKEEELDIATADQAIREVKATWPQVQGVKADGTLMLKKGLLVSGAMLPYRLVLPFISEGCIDSTDWTKRMRIRRCGSRGY